ncbi:uncharacterized, partial [Tachysurus ichikawai]
MRTATSDPLRGSDDATS